jgi:hypothetical protein
MNDEPPLREVRARAAWAMGPDGQEMSRRTVVRAATAEIRTARLASRAAAPPNGRVSSPDGAGGRAASVVAPTMVLAAVTAR